ncbi:MAG: hypothetical protein R2705_18510 [Ilumatobacteraceae bacterium]
MTSYDLTHEAALEAQEVEQDLELEEMEGLDVETLSPTRLAWKRYWHHKGAAVSTIILLFVMFMVIATPITRATASTSP